ncbi:hypothetical protein KY320_03245 [Candidatus Woesearchaeota archaeon]|nr:hypothetical protein [Candidatus Woesearchaeota archaeon]
MPIFSNDRQIREAFNKIKKELDDHLEAINQNTTEIQANYEYQEKLEQKIDKLNEKFEELIMLLDPNRIKERLKAEHLLKGIKLTTREQEVFLILYTASDFLSYDEVARKLGLTRYLVSRYATNLIEKGIPILKRYSNRQPELKLEPWFKELQAKEGIVEIEPKIANCYLS